MREDPDRKNVRELAAVLREKAAVLHRGERHMEPLRQIEVALRALELESHDSDVRFAAFLVPLLVQDFFYNFAGDIPSSERLYVLRQKIRLDMAEGLNGVASALEQRSTDRLYEAYRALVVSYLKGIEEGQSLPIEDPGGA